MPLCIRTIIQYPPRPVAPAAAPKKTRERGRPKGSVGVPIVDWTAAEIATLGKLMAAHFTWPAISAQLGRSVRSCQAKAYREGFVLASTAYGRRKRKVV